MESATPDTPPEGPLEERFLPGREFDPPVTIEIGDFQDAIQDPKLRAFFDEAKDYRAQLRRDGRSS